MLNNSTKIIDNNAAITPAARSLADRLHINLNFKKKPKHRAQYLEVLIQNFITSGSPLQVPFGDRYYTENRGNLNIPKSINGSVVKDVVKELETKGYVTIEKGNTGANRQYTIVTATSLLLQQINGSVQVPAQPSGVEAVLS